MCKKINDKKGLYIIVVQVKLNGVKWHHTMHVSAPEVDAFQRFQGQLQGFKVFLLIQLYIFHGSIGDDLVNL